MPVIGMSHSELLTLISFNEEEIKDISPVGEYEINEDLEENKTKENIQNLVDKNWLLPKENGTIRLNNAIEPALGTLINPSQVIQLQFLNDKGNKKIYLLNKDNYWVIYTVDFYGQIHTLEYPFTIEKLYNWVYNLLTLAVNTDIESIPKLEMDLREKEMVALGIMKAIYQKRIQTGVKLEGEYSFISLDIIKKIQEAQSLLNTVFKSEKEVDNSYKNLVEKGIIVSLNNEKTFYGYSDTAKKVFDPGLTVESILIKTLGKKETVQTVHIMKNGLVFNKVDQDNTSHIKTYNANIKEKELFGILFGETIEISNNKKENKVEVTKKTCSNCGTEIKADAKFCPGCGNKIEAQKFCSGCGTNVLAKQKFCKKCGNKL